MKMKKSIVLVILLLTNFLLVKAQVTPTTPIIPLGGSINNPAYTNPISTMGSYFKDTENKFNQWVGTWQYENGTTLVKIVITKLEAVYVPANTIPGRTPCYVDLLVGGYYYRENSVVKTNHLTYADNFRPPLKCQPYENPNPNSLSIYYDEIDKSPDLMSSRAYLTFLTGSTTQAKWEFASESKRNYSIPDNVILTKVP